MMRDEKVVHALDLKIPPPVVALTTAALMWLVALCAPGFNYVLPQSLLLTKVLAAASGAICLIAIVLFKKAKTTVNPKKPDCTSCLVISGIYQFTRNPMYLGLLLLLFAWAIYLSNAMAFILVPAYVLYMNRFQIIPEERALASLFGEEFSAYKARVRRWL